MAVIGYYPFDLYSEMVDDYLKCVYPDFDSREWGLKDAQQANLDYCAIKSSIYNYLMDSLNVDFVILETDDSHYIIMPDGTPLQVLPHGTKH